MITEKRSQVSVGVGSRIGSYRVVRFLGRGGSSVVMLGRHVHYDKLVALKFLTKQSGVNSLRLEAALLKLAQHPHVVQMYGYSSYHDVPYLVLENVPYGNIRHYRQRRKVLPLYTVLLYLDQIADALQCLHDQGIVHQDVKPENILVRHPDYLVLSDFGIAASPLADDRSVRGQRQIFGTLSYMAPERILGETGPASDQYSLAVMVYEWLTGHVPFSGSSEDVMSLHLHSDVPSLGNQVPSLPLAAEQVLLKALAKEPYLRFTHVREFADAFIDAVLQARSVSDLRDRPHTLRVSLEQDCWVDFPHPATSQVINDSQGHIEGPAARTWKWPVFLLYDLGFVLLVSSFLALWAKPFFSPGLLGFLCVSLPLLRLFVRSHLIMCVLIALLLYVSLLVGILFHSLLYFYAVYVVVLLFLLCLTSAFGRRDH